MVQTHYLKHIWHGPNFWTGMMLLRKGNTAFLLDTAVGGAVEHTLEPFFRAQGLEWKALARIINTHSHGDHAECNAQLKALSGAEISIHSAGAENLRAQGHPADSLLNDGDVISQDGLSVRIIHTPGHSADSICILEETTGTLFTGDSVQGQGSRNIGFALYDDHGAYRQSLLKLRSLCADGTIRRMVMGHPERPAEGVAEQGELLPFLDLSLKTAEDDLRTAEKFLRHMPEGDDIQLQEYLLREWNCRPESEWNWLALTVSRALLRVLRQ